MWFKILRHNTVKKVPDLTDFAKVKKTEFSMSHQDKTKWMYKGNKHKVEEAMKLIKGSQDKGNNPPGHSPFP